jgi:uncharacterized protein YqfB (UPF0267 family)
VGVLKGIQKLVSKQAEGVITSDNALSIGRRIKDPERQLALAKAIGQEGVSQANARNIVKEAARYPGEAMPKIIKRVVETAPEVRLTPEHAEIVRMEGQSQVCLTRVDPIIPGARVDLYAKFAEIKVASIEKKALRDLTEKDAEAEGGYSLNEFKTFWKQSHTVWNPRLKVFLVNFQVDKLAKGGKVK